MKKIKENLITIIILLIISLLSLYPFYTMIVMSTYKTEDIFRGLPILPSNFFIENLKTVFNANFLRPYLNSLFVSFCATLGCTVLSAMAGYGMRVYRFRFKKVVFKFIMMTMMVPTQIGVIGYMIEMRTLHLGGTIWPLILSWLASGFGVYWMTQFSKTALPMELVECARIDGCNEFHIFWQIAIPCMRSGLVTLALLIFLWSWNSYLTPLVLINKPANYTIPVFIKTLGNAFRTDYGAQITGLFLATVPLVILFIVCSKNFIKGLTAGAVKG